MPLVIEGNQYKRHADEQRLQEKQLIKSFSIESIDLTQIYIISK